MPGYEFTPQQLIPIEQTPSLDILFANFADGDNISDLFPYTPENLDGILGDYCGDDPATVSPLGPLSEGLRTYRSQVIRQGETNDTNEESDAIDTVLVTTMLHVQLLRNIDQAYWNLLAEEVPQARAVEIIEAYVDVKTAQMSNFYNNKLDELIVKLAEQERTKEPILPDFIDIAGTRVPNIGQFVVGISPFANEQQESQDSLASSIRQTKLRLHRLAYENLSAMAILEALKQGIEAVDN
jgi:hypothetical protein